MKILYLSTLNVYTSYKGMVYIEGGIYMRNVNEYAKYFLKKELDGNPNTFDGNMKLQKLLFFSNMINLTQHNELLFGEEMLAFEGGTVIEEVRQRYKNDFDGYLKDSIEFNPNFNSAEYEVLNTTIDIFGHLSARELSDLNHTFAFWQISLEKSKNPLGYHDKEKAVIPVELIKEETDKVSMMLDSYFKNKQINHSQEVINGIKFNYDPSEIDIDSVISELEEFSNCADESSYTVYFEDEAMVIM